MVTFYVRKLDAGPVQPEAFFDLVKITLRVHAAVMRGQYDGDSPPNSPLGHFGDNLFDPGGPMPHADPASKARTEFFLQGGCLAPADIENRRSAADVSVVVSDLLDNRAGRGPAGPDIRKIARDFL
jgi:hypothetical protein